MKLNLSQTAPANRRQRRAAERAQAKADRRHVEQLRRAGKTIEQAAADVSNLHSKAHALMWYACPCGHRERIWNSRANGVPFTTDCPPCGKGTLQHLNVSRDVEVPDYQPHDGQRVFVDMTRDQAEVIVARLFRRMNLNIDHPQFAPTADKLMANTSGDRPMLAKLLAIDDQSTSASPTDSAAKSATLSATDRDKA